MNFESFFEPVYVGCSLNILRNATKIELYSIQDEENDRVCSICQQNYIEGEFIRKILHCSHYYHQDCLDKWFENNVKCPECQYDIRTNQTNTTDNANTNTNTSPHEQQQQTSPSSQTFASTIPIPMYTFVMPQTTTNEIPPLNYILQNILNSINNGNGNVSVSMNTSTNTNTTNTTNNENENDGVENENNDNDNDENDDDDVEDENDYNGNEHLQTFIDIQYLTNISQPRNDNSEYISIQEQKLKELETEIKTVKLKLSEVEHKINQKQRTTRYPNKRQSYREIYDSTDSDNLFSDSDEPSYNYKIWNDDDDDDEDDDEDDDSNNAEKDSESSNMESSNDEYDEDEFKKNSIIKNVNIITKYDKVSLSIWDYLVSLFK